MHENAAIRNVIREILHKSLTESDDIDWDLHELLDDIKMEQMSEFHQAMMSEKPDDEQGRHLKARQPWNVVDFSTIKRQWEEYMKWGKVLPLGDWIEADGQWRLSDYGLKPLHKLLVQLRKEFDPSKKLPILDKMLNVVHQRSDIASWFVEGGSSALSQLSGMEEKPL